MHWANRVTIIRILLIPVFVILVTSMERSSLYRQLAVVLFALMVASDALDGYLARKMRTVTEFGKFVDPLADKLLLVTSFWILASQRFFESPPVPFWVAVVVISRDIYIAIGFSILYLITGKKVIQPSAAGKASTDFQLAAIGAALLATFVPGVLMQGLFVVTAILAGVSLLQYTVVGVKNLEAFEREKPRQPGSTGSDP